MDRLDEYTDFSSYFYDGPPLESPDDNLQERQISNDQAINSISTEVMEDRTFIGNFLPETKSDQFSQEQFAMSADAFQIPSISAINPRSDGLSEIQWTSNALDGQCQLSEMSPPSPYADSYSLELLSQPIETANEQYLTTPFMVGASVARATLETFADRLRSSQINWACWKGTFSKIILLNSVWADPAFPDCLLRVRPIRPLLTLTNGEGFFFRLTLAGREDMRLPAAGTLK